MLPYIISGIVLIVVILGFVTYRVLLKGKKPKGPELPNDILIKLVKENNDSLKIKIETLNARLRSLQMMMEQNKSHIDGILSSNNLVDSKFTIHKGKVSNVHALKATVELDDGQKGYLPLKETSLIDINTMADILAVNQTVYVSIIGLDKNGKMELSSKMIDQKTGLEITRERNNFNESSIIY
jgi:predicted RNA-binding protein with RPS1 domain